MYCGHENDDRAENCVKCGNRLLNTASASSQNYEAPRSNQSGWSGRNSGYDGGYMAGNYEDDGQNVNNQYMNGSDQDGYYDQNAYGQNMQSSGQDPYYGQNMQPSGQDPYYGQNMQSSGRDYNGQASRYDQDYAGGGYSQQNQGYDRDSGMGRTYAEQNPSDYPQMYDHEIDQEPEEYETSEVVPSASGPIRKKARKRVRSPLFFLAMLLFTASTISGIVYTAMNYTQRNLQTITDTIRRFAGEHGKIAIGFMDSAMELLGKVDESLLKYIQLGGFVPAVLLMIGLWLIFVKTSNKREKVSTGGYVIAKIGLILKFIIVIFAMLGAIALAVLYVITAASGSTRPDVISLIIGIVALLAVVIFAVFAIMYYIQVLFSLRVVKTNVKSGTFIGKIPGFAIFVNVLGCAVTVLCMLLMAPDDYLGLACFGTYAGWLLIISLWALIYRITVKRKNK